jgi:hypothetical protein
MFGRQPIDEALMPYRYLTERHRQRRAVLRETIAHLDGGGRARLLELAARNLARWTESAAGRAVSEGLRVRVISDDWGVATHRATRETGICHAALNMANAWLPGGRYIEGTSAQEENVFRRTDCHFTIDASVYDAHTDRYLPAVSDLLNAKSGRVMLDTARPRVCFRGPEEPDAPALGYALLPEDEVFPFFELRAAAVNCGRPENAFDPGETRRRVAAQLDTLQDAGVTHAVLSAFGCGAFMNPADKVARAYREELARGGRGLRDVTFAIFDPGYATGNFATFAEVFEDFGAA